MHMRFKPLWLLPLALAAGVLVVVAGLPRGAIQAEAQTVPPALTVDAIIDAMQERADQVASFTAVIGRQVTLPEAGLWQGVAVAYSAQEAYARRDGWVTDSLEKPPVQVDNAWQIFREGYIFHRPRRRELLGWVRNEVGELDPVTWTERGATVRVRPGDVLEGISYGTDVDAILMVNLMPKAWFEPVRRDLAGGYVTQVGDTSYYVLVDMERSYGSNQLVRFPALLQERTPRMYYINANTFVCERLVWGNPDASDPFAQAGRDVVVNEVGAVAGALMPTRWELRMRGTGGPYFIQAGELVNLVTGTVPSELSFDPYVLAGPQPVIMRPTDSLDELVELADRGTDDLGVLLTIADLRRRVGQVIEAEKALEAAAQLAGKVPTPEFYALKSRIYGRMSWDLLTCKFSETTQLEAIYRRRADRLRAAGNDRHADDLAARAAAMRARKREVMAEAAEALVVLPEVGQ